MADERQRPVPGDLIVERDGCVITLTLNRPERRNALTPRLISDLHHALEAVDADEEARVVVLTGAGAAFCAGFDIAHIASPGGADAGAERDMVERLARRLDSMRVPVIARVNGVASGAGCDLAICCDVRVASSAARFAMPPARLGLLYSWQGMARLVRAVGGSAAKSLMFEGELIDAQRAVAIGLVTDVVAPERLDERVAELVGRVAENAPLSLAAAKLIIDVLARGTTLTADDMERIAAATEAVWCSEDSIEGPRAFRERRRPHFTGR